MKRLFTLLIGGIGTALAVFAVLGVIWDVKSGGNYGMNNWSYTKMVIGSIVVGIGYSVPALIYDNPNIPYGMQVLFHMGIGSAVYIITSFAVGWIPASAGAGSCVLAVGAELLLAFGLWLCFNLYYRKMAKEMDRKIKDLKSED